MYKGFNKGDEVFLAAQREAHSDLFFVEQASVWRKGRAYLDVEHKGMNIRFRDNGTIGSDMFGRLYFLFKTEKETKDYIKQRETRNDMKERILRVISKCNFEELEDIYLYLEARYPKEMR